MCGAMGGESHTNGNANTTSRGVHVPAAAAAVAANRRSGEGNAGKGSGGGSCVEKRKFTVSVRGRCWSCVRYCNETLEEFAAAIVRDVRRLAFRDNGDSIQGLQLDYSDGSEPEDLDVDATFGVGTICLGNEQLLDIVMQHLDIVESNQLTPPARMPRTTTPNQHPDSECTPLLTNAVDRNCHDSVAAPRSSPDLLARNAAPKFPFPDHEPPYSAALTTNPRVSKNYAPAESPSRQFQPVERARSFHPDYVAGAGANLPPLPRSSAKLNMGGAGKPASGPRAVQQQFCNPTLSSAELADVLVRSPSDRMLSPGATRVSASSNTHSPAGSQSFESFLVSRFPTLSNRTVECPHGSNINIALLAQFLASQFQEFSTSGAALPSPASSPAGSQSFESFLESRFPTLSNRTVQCPHGSNINIALLVQFLASQFQEFSTSGAALPSPASCGFNKAPIVTDAVENPVSSASPGCNLQVKQENRPESGVQEKYLRSPNHLGGTINAKRSLRGATSHGYSKQKSPSSSGSSANERNSLVSQSEELDNELSNGGSEIVVTVHRRKTGDGTHYLKKSDISPHFHLILDNAAKKLGVSKTTLKKACRIFGVNRWPGRKVRSLLKTTQGLSRGNVVGQGPGLDESTEPDLRSEILRLQQKMKMEQELVDGTPLQVTQKMHSPSARTVGLYKRLSPGGRSKYHSAGRHA